MSRVAGGKPPSDGVREPPDFHRDTLGWQNDIDKKLRGNSLNAWPSMTPSRGISPEDVKNALLDCSHKDMCTLLARAQACKQLSVGFTDAAGSTCRDLVCQVIAMPINGADASFNNGTPVKVCLDFGKGDRGAASMDDIFYDSIDVTVSPNGPEIIMPNRRNNGALKRARGPSHSARNSFYLHW